MVLYAQLVMPVNMPLLNLLPQALASAVRKATVKLVLHLPTSRHVPSALIITISPQAPASLVQSPTV